MTREPVRAPGAPRLDSRKVLAAIAFHLAALLAPWTFTWAGLILLLTLNLLVGQLGISLGNHRLLAHRSYQVARPLRYLFAFWGVLAYQAGPLTWCAIHRLHHRHSDRDDDPQMSHRSLAWSHYLWTLMREWPGLETPEDVRRVTRDLQREPILQFLERHFHVINLLVALGLFGLGWVLGGWRLGLSLLVWGFFLRVVVSLHLTFLSNSVNHRWGYRNYETRDNSRNCWWVALLSFGEWHNNHHQQASSAAFGHRWFEIDTSYLLIRTLERVGLASRVVRPRSGHLPRPEDHLGEETPEWARSEPVDAGTASTAS
jgi:fatty-acid desaturase